MTPNDLARRHAELYHVTTAGSAESILRHGLLTTCAILERWETPAADRVRLSTRRRPLPTPIEHPALGRVVLNDNAPLNETKLAKVLDDGLTPADWLLMLNSRVFFFVDERPLRNLTNAQLNRGVAKDVLVFDTLSLAQAYAPLLEIAPINSGNTNYDAARRGRSTFAPLLDLDFDAWRRSRPKKSLDSIREVTVRGSIPDIARFVKHVRYAETAR